MVTGDERVVEAARGDWRAHVWDRRDQAMLELVEKLTLKPASCSREDIRAMREAGFSDPAILQVTMIASFFNYINRVADALGVGRDPA